MNVQWASDRDFCNYRTSEERGLGQVCVYVQTRKSLRFSQTIRMDMDEGSDRNVDLSFAVCVNTNVYHRHSIALELLFLPQQVYEPLQVKINIIMRASNKDSPHRA